MASLSINHLRVWATWQLPSSDVNWASKKRFIFKISVKSSYPGWLCLHTKAWWKVLRNKRQHVESMHSVSFTHVGVFVLKGNLTTGLITALWRVMVCFHKAYQQPDNSVSVSTAELGMLTTDKSKTKDDLEMGGHSNIYHISMLPGISSLFYAYFSEADPEVACLKRPCPWGSGAVDGAGEVSTVLPLLSPCWNKRQKVRLPPPGSEKRKQCIRHPLFLEHTQAFSTAAAVSLSPGS